MVGDIDRKIDRQIDRYIDRKEMLLVGGNMLHLFKLDITRQIDKGEKGAECSET